MRREENVIMMEKEIISIILLIGSIFVFWGCDRVINFRKEASEEKKNLSYVQGYNPKIKEIEKLLKEEKFDPGLIDGVMSKQTRKALMQFQKANSLKETGFYDAETKSKLDLISAEKAKKKQEVKSQEVKPSAKIRKAQEALKKAGFDPGPINGLMGDKTRKAIRSFQKSKGLYIDGALNQKTWDQLSKYFPKK